MPTMMTTYQTAAVFRPDRFNPVILAENERTKVILVCLEPGQFIPVHRPQVDVAFVILEGEGMLVAGEREEAVRAGVVAFVPAGEDRGLKAETRLLALHVVTPPPTQADHTGVMAGLAKSEWR
jgi:quercetin dioxygenase-like cupin family protein